MDQQMHRNPGDTIRSEDWNAVIDELMALRQYIDNMARSVTLSALQSPTGSMYGLSKGVPEEFNYETDVIGLVTRQYFLGEKNVGETCRFGIHDYADILYYWSGAALGDQKALRISLEYIDNTTAASPELFVHEWSVLRPKGTENPYYEYILSPNHRLMYKYGFENPQPEKAIRYIIFEDINEKCALRVGNVIQYVTRVKPLETKKKA